MTNATVRQETQRSILFADVVGSTELYERLGDEAAKTTIEGYLSILADTVGAFRGKVVKNLGDGILCTFVSPEEAVWAAVRVCQKLATQEMEVRIGVHCGPVIEDHGDVYGDAVNTAARIADRAKPSEILISREVSEFLPAIMHPIVQRVPPVAVKGKKNPLELFAILKVDATAETGPAFDLSRTITIEASSCSRGDLELTYKRTKLTIRAGESIKIGRDPQNDIVVTTEHVSRLHAKIFHRQGKYVLHDQSSNGTFLSVNLSNVHLLREEAILHGSGLIYLGADPSKTHSEPILYMIPQSRD